MSGEVILYLYVSNTLNVPVQTYAHSIGNSGVERQRRISWYAVSEQREIGVWQPIVGSKDKLCFNCC